MVDAAFWYGVGCGLAAATSLYVAAKPIAHLGRGLAAIVGETVTWLAVANVRSWRIGLPEVDVELDVEWIPEDGLQLRVDGQVRATVGVRSVRAIVAEFPEAPSILAGMLFNSAGLDHLPDDELSDIADEIREIIDPQHPDL